MVQMRNGSRKEVIAVEYVVELYNGFGRALEEKVFQWQSGNIVKSITSSESIPDIHTYSVKGCNRISANILKVRYRDGIICDNRTKINK